MRVLRFVVVSLVAALLAAFSLPACSVVNAPEEVVEPSGSSSSSTGGSGTGGMECDADAPTVTSATTQAFAGATAQYTLTFSEEVTLTDNALSVDGGATIAVTPSLPATGSSFTVDLTGLTPGTEYTLTVSAAGVTDDCANSLAADVAVTVSDDCDADTVPPSLNVTEVDFMDGITSGTFTLEFSEPTRLAMGAITATGSATVDNVMPALPATATTFEVTVGNLVDSTRLVVLPGSIEDACGNSPSTAQELLLCNEAGGSVTFNTPGNFQFVVPACAGTAINIVALGAQGGTSGSGTGGLGGMASGNLTVAAGETLEVNVGGAGTGATGMAFCDANGGFNGGGKTGGPNATTCCSNAGSGAGSGGGASDVRQIGPALSNRVIVAGGGGGASSGKAGGDGGGLTGVPGTGDATYVAAGGGTQTVGGIPGGHFANHTCNAAGPGALGIGGVGDGNDGGGGGGGLYGGGGGGNNHSAAGGSSYVGGVMNGMTMPGMNTGDGSVTINWM